MSHNAAMPVVSASPAAENIYTRASWISEGSELVQVLAAYGACAGFAGSFLYVAMLSLQTNQQPYFSIAAIVGSGYLIVLCTVRILLPYLRRRVRLTDRHVVIGAGPLAQRVPYARIEEIWTAPNEIIHLRTANPFPPGILFRIRTALKLYEIPLRYAEVDSCAVNVWQRSGAVYWDMHGRKNLPFDQSAPRSRRPPTTAARLMAAWPHLMVIAILATLTVVSSLYDTVDSVVDPPPPMAPLAIVAGSLFAAAPAWQVISAFRTKTLDITR